MCTQRASSPQMLALVAQLVSLGSVGDRRCSLSPSCPRWGVGSPTPRSPGAPLTGAAVLLVGAVPAVIKHVAAQREGQAALVPAQKFLLVFAVWGLSGGGLWGGRGLQVLSIRRPAPPPRGAPSVAGEGGTQTWPSLKLAGEAGQTSVSTSTPRALRHGTPSFRGSPFLGHSSHLAHPYPYLTAGLPRSSPRPGSPQSSSSVPSPQLSVPSHWRPIHRQTRSFLQRKGRFGGHTNRAAGAEPQSAPGPPPTRKPLSAPSASEPHHTPQGSHLSCPRSRPRRRTSRPGACTGCCCTGTRPGGRSALHAGGGAQSAARALSRRLRAAGPCPDLPLPEQSPGKIAPRGDFLPARRLGQHCLLWYLGEKRSFWEECPEGRREPYFSGGRGGTLGSALQCNHRPEEEHWAGSPCPQPAGQSQDAGLTAWAPVPRPSLRSPQLHRPALSPGRRAGAGAAPLRGGGWGRGWREGLTACAAGFLVAAIHAVRVRVAAPAQGDAVAALALELVHVAAGCAVFLWAREQACRSGPGPLTDLWRPPPLASLPTSSEPSAQSWSPSHFQRPAMQRPLAQENSLSEQGRGAGEDETGRRGWAQALSPQGPLQPWAEQCHPLLCF